jgi:translation initiation factor IF-2
MHRVLLPQTISRSAVRTKVTSTSSLPADTPKSLGKWSLPPATVWAVPPSSSRPQTLSKSPASGALNKWAQPVPIKKRSDADKQHPPSSRLNTTFSPPPVIRTDPRLQRDVAPHQDPRAEHKRPPNHSFFNRSNQQYQRPMEQASNSRLLPNSSTANQPGRETASAARKPHFAAEPAAFEWTKDRQVRSGRPHRTAHKERGSLLLQTNQDSAVPRHLKPEAFQKQIKTKKKCLVEKHVSPDIYIPTTVSVGTLARLLGVRLGKVILALIVTLFTLLYQNICNVE